MKLGIFIMGCALALLACILVGCDDRLEVRQVYDFSLSSWYLQEGITPDDTVEVRLTLNREGDHHEARCRIGYIQLEGDGEVFGTDGTRLANREPTDLSGIAGLDTTDTRRQVSILFYRNTGKDNPGIRFMTVDNFFVERTLNIPFFIKDKTNTGTVKQRKAEAVTEQDKYGMEQFAEYLDMWIRNEEKNIKEDRDRLDQDYLYYFTWNGEDLFKFHFTVKQYGELRQVIWQAEVPGEVHGYIRYKREECLKELVSGSIRRRSTNDIFNLAHTYRPECMQKLARDYTGLEWLLSMKAPQKEMKMKKDPEGKKPDGLRIQRV